jgi:hypothetical protein
VGEGTTRIEEKKPPREIEREIEHLRTRLDRSLAELDRRRHELTDLKLQMRKHPQVFIGAGTVVALMLGGIGFAIWRAQERKKPVARAHRLRIAVGRAVDHPQRVANEPSVGQKIVAAVGSAVAVSLAKKLLDRAWNALPPPHEKWGQSLRH